MQEVALSGHFFSWSNVVRSRVSRSWNFNGTAGVWRRSAVAAVGIWEHDTIGGGRRPCPTSALLRPFAMSLCGSGRPLSELPTSIAAYRSQQTRWFKGFGQPFAKKAADAFTSSNTPVVHKVVFFFHTLPSLCYADTVMFQLYFWPAVFVSVPFSWAWLGVNLGAQAMFWAFYSLTLYRALGFWRGLAAQWRIAGVMVLCWGMAPLLATAPVQGTSSSDATVFFFMDYADAQAGRHRGRRIIVARRAQRAGRVGFDHPLGAGRHPGTAAGGSGGARGHDDGDGDGCGVGGGG